MDKKYIIGGAVAAVIIIIIAAIALGGSSTSHAEDELVACVAAHGEEPEYGYDPMHGWGYHDSGTEPLIQSTILKRDADNNFVNDLATSYTASDDYKTYTVDIRDDVNFTDGTHLTAKDVAFSYNTAKEYGEGADLSSMINATAVNDTQVRFDLNLSDSTFVNKLTDVGIVPADSYDNETYGQNPIGSGPYKLAQWDKGQQVIFEINDDYYGEKPYFKKVTNLYLDSDAAFAAVQNGEVDIAEVPVTYANETVEGFHTEYFDSIDVRGISLPLVNNTGETIDDRAIGNNVTADPAIREALNVGINRSAIFENALAGYGNVSYTGVATQLPWSYESNVTDGQVDQAKEILSNAGWTDTDGDGIVEKDGTKASFQLDYSSSDSVRQAIAVSTAEEAKNIGIEITPEGKSFDEIYPEASTVSVVWGFGSADPTSLFHQYDGRMAAQSYDNPEILNDTTVNNLIDSARSQDLNSSYSTWSSVAQQANEQIPYLWIGSVDYVYFVNDTLDISHDTHLIYPHGGDIWGNIRDWTRVNATSDSTDETNDTANNTTG